MFDFRIRCEFFGRIVITNVMSCTYYNDINKNVKPKSVNSDLSIRDSDLRCRYTKQLSGLLGQDMLGDNGRAELHETETLLTIRGTFRFS